MDDRDRRLIEAQTYIASALDAIDNGKACIEQMTEPEGWMFEAGMGFHQARELLVGVSYQLGQVE